MCVAICQYLVPGQAEVDRNVKALSASVMVPHELDRDVARDDSVADRIELLPALLDVLCQCVRVSDVAKRNLERRLHVRDLFC